MMRTHTCGELTKKSIGASVTLCGWVHRVRDHGNLIFIHIRDRFGITQLVYNLGTQNESLHQQIKALNREDCIQASGWVIERDVKDYNPTLKTGEIEVSISALTLLNASCVPPFEVADKVQVNDDLRLRHRYIDLRRPRMQRNIQLRHDAIQIIRTSLADQGFLEIETPLFVRTTPEGARDFIVPSRLHPGRVYSLPQSPQLYKQLLMIGGMDRYFQFSPCFRDEDLRADRAFIFTQVDMEMAFVEERDVMSAVEHYVAATFKALRGIELTTPFDRMSYAEAIRRFGVDKPDLRFGMELKDITAIAGATDMPVFQETAHANGAILAIVCEGKATLSRKQIETFGEFVKIYDTHNLFYTKVTDNKLETGVAKHFNRSLAEKLIADTGAKDGDLLLIIADTITTAQTAMGQLRNKLGKTFELIDPDDFKFLWIHDFPLFEWDHGTNQWVPMHHVFTMPSPGTRHHLKTDPGKVHGILYDLVGNGVELLSGSIRVHQPEIQREIFKTINLSTEEADAKFGFLLKALEYGAPPHGGSALGFDRFVAMLAGEESIREVTAFPHNASGIYPLDGSPSIPDEFQLKELKLRMDWR